MGEVTPERLDMLERYYATRGRDEVAASLKVATMQDLIAALRAERAANAALGAENIDLRSAVGLYIGALDDDQPTLRVEMEAFSAAEDACRKALGRQRSHYAAIAEARTRVCEAARKQTEAADAWWDHLMACANCERGMSAPERFECAVGQTARRLWVEARGETRAALRGLAKAEDGRGGGA